MPNCHSKENMHNSLQRIIFTAYFNKIVLFCFLNRNIVIAHRLIGNPYHIPANNVKYIDNEGRNENNENMDVKAKPYVTSMDIYNAQETEDLKLLGYYKNFLMNLPRIIHYLFLGHYSRLKNIPTVEKDYYIGNNYLYYNYNDNVLIDYYSEYANLKLNIDGLNQNASHSSKEIDVRIHRQASKLKIHRFLELLKIWFLVYSALAIPLWCTKGWCCCCLLCKCFKPNKIIEEAKVFLETNPPGVFQHREGLIYYEPSENERECYEKLEYLIRTI